MKKICFLVSHLHAGGAERTVSYLSNFLQKKFDVSIISFERDVIYRINPNVKLYCLNIKPETKFFNRCMNVVRRYIGVLKIVWTIKPDVVFCMLPPMLKYVLYLKFLFNFKLVSSERNNPFFDKEMPLRAKRKYLKKCDGVVFQTKNVSDLFPEITKKCIIHNAVGNPQIDLAKKKREQYRIENKIVSVGRLCYQKNWSFIIEVFSILHKDYPHLFFEIYGDGPDKSMIEKQIIQLNLEKNILLKGTCPDVALQIANAKIFVIASRYEGMPNALMEAMAIGIPCVSNDCDYGPSDLIDPEKNGLIIPSSASAQEFAGAVKRFLEDESFATLCGQNGQQILFTHSMETQSQQYVDFISSLI